MIVLVTGDGWRSSDVPPVPLYIFFTLRVHPFLSWLSLASALSCFQATFSFRSCFFFFNDTATTEIYTLSLHDALPISASMSGDFSKAETKFKAARTSGASTAQPGRSSLPGTPVIVGSQSRVCGTDLPAITRDRKSTRLNSSHT